MKKGFVKTLALSITVIGVVAIVCIAAFASSETNFAAAPADETASEVVIDVNDEETEEEVIVEETEETEETEAAAEQTQQSEAQQAQRTGSTQRTSSAQRTNTAQRTNSTGTAQQSNQTAAQPQQTAAQPQQTAAQPQQTAAQPQQTAAPETEATTTAAPETEAPTTAAAEAPAPSGPVATYSDVPFVGVLHIPSAGINVELYASSSQSVTDRQNSANCFSVGFFPGKIIADHSSQAFSSLTSVHAGTSGYIEYANGSVRNITCSTAFTGHNTDYELTDDNYNVIPGGAFALYTCMGSWQNIYVAIFN